MMFDGKKNDPGPSQEVEDKIIVHHKLPEVVPFFHLRPQLAEQGLALPRTGWMRRKRAAGLGIAAQ